MVATDLRFVRLGRGWHPELLRAADLRGLLTLDPALWAANAAPLSTLRMDKVFLKGLDVDGDGRLRIDEVQGGIRWTLDALADTADLELGRDALRLVALKKDGEGGRLQAVAERALTRLGRPGAAELTLAEVRAVRAEEEARGLSEAGLALVSAAEDAALRAFIERVIVIGGAEAHPTGQPAVSAASLDRALAEAAAWVAWVDAGIADAATVLPLGDSTEDALAALEAISDKLHQYFLICDAVALDPALAARSWPDGAGADLLDPVAATAFLARAPLARPRPDGVLDPTGPINPAWAEQVAVFAERAFAPLLGETPITRVTVKALRAKLAAFVAWRAARPSTKAADLPIDALRADLADVGLAAGVRELLQRSHDAAVAFDGIVSLERLILNQQNLLRLVNSFAANLDLYDTGRTAQFEEGTLVVDGRRFSLAVRVPDRARHEAFCKRGTLFVIYALIGEKGGAWEYEVAVPVTAGMRGALQEGLWGVFIDRDGRERHAYISGLVANSVSVEEALLAPFMKIGEMIQGLADKASGSASASMDSKVAETTTAGFATASSAPGKAMAPAEPAAVTATAAAPGAAPGAATATVTTGGGGMAASLPLLLAGAGLAFAAISSAFAFIAGELAKLTPLQILGVFVALVLAYVIPVSFAAWLRLRRRDLATILEGSGWAVNTRLYLNRQLARQFTTRPDAPNKSVRRSG